MWFNSHSLWQWFNYHGKLTWANSSINVINANQNFISNCAEADRYVK